MPKDKCSSCEEPTTDPPHAVVFLWPDGKEGYIRKYCEVCAGCMEHITEEAGVKAPTEDE